MKNKRIIILIVVVIVSIAAIVGVGVVLNGNKNGGNNLVDDPNGSGYHEGQYFQEDLTKEYPKIKKFLSNSSYFSKSNIEEDKEKEAIIVDGKYTIGLRQGYIYLNIGYDEAIDDYCKIVEAIETGLGSKADAKKACENALTGSIVNASLMVSYEEEGWFVILNTNAPMSEAQEEFHSAGEKIKVGSRDFGMSIDGFNLSNTSSGWNEYTKSTKICFTMYNKSKTPRDFVVRMYDGSDNVIHEGTYSYKGDDRPAEHTCIDYEGEEGAVKSFTIN